MRTALLIPNGRLAAEVRLRLGEERGFEEVATIESLPGAERIAEVVEPLEAEALFVEVAAEGGGALLEALRRAAPEAFLVACAETLQGSEAVQWLRMGASDCFYGGMPAEDVRALVARMRVQQEARKAKTRPRRGRVAGFVSLKPGAGASTLAEQVAFTLRRQGGSVLLVDLNLAAGTTASWADGPEQPDVLQALAHPGQLDSDEEWRRRTAWRGGVRALPAPLIPAEDGLDGCGDGLNELLETARRHFDWTLVDLPPAAEAGTARLAAELDRVVAVAAPDLASLHLAARRLQEFAAQGVEEASLRVVVNRTTGRDLIGLSQVETLFGHAVSASVPEDCPALAAVGRGELCGESPLSVATRALTAALAGRAPEPRPQEPVAGLALELAAAG